MNTRFYLNNLLLLLVLTTTFVVSGGLLCGLDGLKQTEHQHGSAAVRVDECHLATPADSKIVSCANKACHQSHPQRQDLGGPQLFSLNSAAQPISASVRVQLPQLRSGDPLPSSAWQPAPLLTLNTSELPVPSQQYLSLRTTVLLN